MKKCTLALKTVSVPTGAEADVIEIMSPAEFTVTKNGTYKIKYEETDLAGYEGAVTEMLIKDDKAQIKRTGTSKMCLRLDLLKKHYTVYQTPYGELSLGVVTHSIDNRLSENGGDIAIKYSLEMDAKPFTDNEIQMNIKL
jgi:uncharacterized beta-barrel protein YwiB (DUF1934 family)